MEKLGPYRMLPVFWVFLLVPIVLWVTGVIELQIAIALAVFFSLAEGAYIVLVAKRGTDV